MTDLIELPVDWFDAPEPVDDLTNNDLDPTGSDPLDYRGPGRWEEYVPHPDMEGVVCSSGWVHEARRWLRPPVAPVGIAACSVRRSEVLACHG